MFDLEYKGAGAIVVTTKQTTLFTDPKLSLVGLKDLVYRDGIELVTQDRFVVPDDDLRLLIEGPGEYEAADFSIRGIPAMRHIDTEKDGETATIYRIEIGEVRIALLGHIAPNLTDEQLESLGVIDILILPVGGGGYTLDATGAAILTRHIDPKVVIPVHYADPELHYEVPQDTLEAFTKELAAPLETTAKYRVKATSSLPPTLTVIEVTRS